MENARVFAETHKLLRSFLAEGLITGLRVDHPDGLLNPLQYSEAGAEAFRREPMLGAEPVAAIGSRRHRTETFRPRLRQEAGDGQAPLYLLVEKILEPGEHLPDHWPVDGTVGYEFSKPGQRYFD